LLPGLDSLFEKIFVFKIFKKPNELGQVIGMIASH